MNKLFCTFFWEEVVESPHFEFLLGPGPYVDADLMPVESWTARADELVKWAQQLCPTDISAVTSLVSAFLGG